jgi:hypothetical protein
MKPGSLMLLPSIPCQRRRLHACSLPCRAVSHPEPSIRLSLFRSTTYLEATSPLFIPSGKLVSSITVELVPRASISLSHIPVGMFWKPKDAINVNLMINSIKALLASETKSVCFIHSHPRSRRWSKNYVIGSTRSQSSTPTSSRSKPICSIQLFKIVFPASSLEL